MRLLLYNNTGGSDTEKIHDISRTEICMYGHNCNLDNKCNHIIYYTAYNNIDYVVCGNGCIELD